MEKQNRNLLLLGILCCFVAVFFAYLTSWLDWNKAVHHSLAALIAIVGLFLIWYGFHKNYYERLLARAHKEIEEAAVDINGEIDKQ